MEDEQSLGLASLTLAVINSAIKAPVWCQVTLHMQPSQIRKESESKIVKG